MINLKSDTKKAEWININPKLAVYMLESNKQNRKISESTLKKLVKKMKSNKFVVTGQTISFNKDGILQDGQHRLQAILESNTTQEICVCFGIPNESKNDYDIGKKRTGGDNLAALNVKYPNEIAGGINVWYSLKNKQYSNNGYKFENKDIVDIYQSKANIIDRITPNLIHYHTSNTLLFSKSKIVGFAYYLLFELNYDIETIIEFYDYFYSLKEINIVGFNEVRNEITKRNNKKIINRLTDYEIYYYLVESFNFFLGETNKIAIKIKLDSIMPEIKKYFSK